MGLKQVVQRVRKRNPSAKAATEEDIAACEQRLGVELPESYRVFAREIGHAIWPVEIFHPSQVKRSEGQFDQPDFLVPFATDGGGNDWCFDVRKRFGEEWAITFWDHEDDDHDDDLAMPKAAGGGFATWLEDRVGVEAAEDEAEERKKRWARLEPLIRAKVGGMYGPDEAEVARVESELGYKLPVEYRLFTLLYGRVDWPVRIVDGTEVLALRDKMQSELGPRKFVPIATDDSGTFWGFSPKRAEVSRVTKEGIVQLDESFDDWIETMIEQRQKEAAANEAKRATTPLVVRRKAKTK